MLPVVILVACHSFALFVWLKLTTIVPALFFDVHACAHARWFSPTSFINQAVVFHRPVHWSALTIPILHRIYPFVVCACLLFPLVATGRSLAGSLVGFCLLPLPFCRRGGGEWCVSLLLLLIVPCSRFFFSCSTVQIYVSLVPCVMSHFHIKKAGWLAPYQFVLYGLWGVQHNFRYFVPYNFTYNLYRA